MQKLIGTSYTPIARNGGRGEGGVHSELYYLKIDRKKL